MHSSQPLELQRRFLRAHVVSSQKDGESLVFSEGSGRPLERGLKLYLGLDLMPILAEDEMENAKLKLREELRTHMDELGKAIF